jgi:quercetin dioxygenase-like cupin family protein
MVPDWTNSDSQGARHRNCDHGMRAAREASSSVAGHSPQGRPRKGAGSRQILVFLSITCLMVLGPFMPGWLAWGAVAQDATPPAGEVAPIAGATIELLDTGAPMDTPGKVLNFVRLTVEPGGHFNAHGHPGAQIWYVDAGMISTTVVEGTIRLTGAPDGATPASTEEIGAGMEAIVSAGEFMFFDHDVIHTLENVGDEPAVILIAAILEAGEPEVIFAEHGAHGEGTPAT